MHDASTAVCHKIQHLLICSSEMAQTALNDIRGMANLSRVDEALYHDHETEAECKVAGNVCHLSQCLTNLDWPISSCTMVALASNDAALPCVGICNRSVRQGRPKISKHSTSSSVR